jgi:hypothetical protein
LLLLKGAAEPDHGLTIYGIWALLLLEDAAEPDHHLTITPVTFVTSLVVQPSSCGLVVRGFAEPDHRLTISGRQSLTHLESVGQRAGPDQLRPLGSAAFVVRVLVWAWMFTSTTILSRVIS